MAQNQTPLTPRPGSTRPAPLKSNFLADNADEIDYEVGWKEGADVSTLTGRALRLQIFLRQTELYALQFTTQP